MNAKRFLLTLTLLAVGAPCAFGQARPGSIYDPDLGPVGTIGNKVARRPGDLVTVIISETQDVNNQESSLLERSSSLDYRLDNFDIKPNAFGTPLPRIAGSTDNEFEGLADYRKSGEFTARLTAIVEDVQPNGNLVVRGRREIRVDRETKVIEFSGVVRRYDVRADNTILSELVADAHVSYTGTGPLTDHTNRSGLGGFLRRALDWLWPF